MTPPRSIFVEKPRHAPDMPLEAETAEMERFWKALLMFELRIEHLTGKEAIELVHERKNR